MEDEHLDAILATESDEVIKSSIENLVSTPSESEGIPNKICDVPLCDHPTPLKTFKEHSKIVIDFNDDSTSSDDDSPYSEDIDYVDASPPDAEIVSSEVVEIVISENEALKDNPTPSSDVMTKSSSISPNLFLEETNTVDNSLPETETFFFNLEEISSGSPTSYSDLSLRDYEAFYLDDDYVEEKSSGSTTTHADFSQYNPTENQIISFRTETNFNPWIFNEVQSKRYQSQNEFFYLIHAVNPLSFQCLTHCTHFSPKMRNKRFNPVILASNDEKSPQLLNSSGLKAFQFIFERLMMIYGENIPILDVSFLYFYPP
ncbi:hypothetical protein Tco_1492205 [Tanacetum coccineum]